MARGWGINDLHLTQFRTTLAASQLFSDLVWGSIGGLVIAVYVWACVSFRMVVGMIKTPPWASGVRAAINLGHKMWTVSYSSVSASGAMSL